MFDAQTASARPRMARTTFLAVLLAAVLAVGVGAPAARAHTELLASTPVEGETVLAPAVVSLTFSEALVQVGTELTVTDAEGTATALVVTFPEPAVVAAELPELAAGTASVAWRVVAEDGHPIEGTLTFVVEAPAPEVQVTLTPEPSPSASSAPPSVAPIATNDAATSDASGGLPPWLWVALVGAIAAAGAVAVMTAKQR